MPVGRSPGETPREEPSDELPTGSRQTSLSQMQTRGRAARMEAAARIPVLIVTV